MTCDEMPPVPETGAWLSLVGSMIRIPVIRAAANLGQRIPNVWSHHDPRPLRVLIGGEGGRYSGGGDRGEVSSVRRVC